MGSVSVHSCNKPAELPAPSSLANDDDGALPADLLYEILLRLAAIELCRLRLVCRSWRSLTSDPGRLRQGSRFPPPALPLEHRSFCLTTQLDLLCVTPLLNGNPPSSVLNLATREVATLPDSSCHLGTCPSVLGYVPSTGEYKCQISYVGSRKSVEGGGGKNSFAFLLIPVVMDIDKGLRTKRCSARYAPSCLHEINIFSPPEPLVLLDDGRTVMWVERKQVMRVYDPRTRTWADLITKLEHCYSANVYTGNLCSSLQG
uniref:F-box domain-containing protein n=1 Tax=Setaria viridis TaxID=4556 RepID=A0A4U6VQE0_SETVI|nr:hypothetical protein SEVIR_2G076100v2 [Setaria viridis]